MYRCNNNSCSCNNNCCMKKNKAIENICNDYNSCSNVATTCPNSSGCGFATSQNVFPSNPMLGQSYVPIQYMDKTFIPRCALKKGSLFPELVSTYYPGQSMMEIDYLKMFNNI